MSDIVFDNRVFDRLREIGDQSQRIGELESEIARLRLTDAEREAIEFCIASSERDVRSDIVASARAAVGRLGGER